MRGRWIVSAALLAATGCEPRISDTGYVGTWSRSNDRNTSTIAIAQVDDAYLFRWRVDSVDGKWRVRCDWEGNCEEFVDGAKAATYRFRMTTDPATGHLVVECTGKVTRPEPLDVHYVDELELEPGGRVLWSFTRLRAGQSFEGEARPRHSFEKVADEVAEPPRAARSR